MLRSFFLPLLALLLLSACSRRADPPPPPPTDAAPEPSLAGRVLHRGAALPAPSAPEPCHPAPPLITGVDGGLADVLVHLPGLPSAAPGELELSADGCAFSPRVAAVPLGTVLVVANDGPGLQTFHLHRLDGTQERPEQNLALPPGAALLRYTLDRPGRYRIAADARPWMQAFLWVVEGGATTVSDGDGRFSLEVPPGDWTAELWHPALGRRSEGVGVPADGPGSLYVTWSESGEDAPGR